MEKKTYIAPTTVAMTMDTCQPIAGSLTEQQDGTVTVKPNGGSTSDQGSFQSLDDPHMYWEVEE